MNKNSIIPLTFIIEILNPPLKYSDGNTRKLFSGLGVYDNYNRITGDIIEFSHMNKDTQETKRLIIRGDKIIISDDFASGTLDSFWKISSDIISKTITALNIPSSFFRQYTIRFLASPLNEKDSRIFLANKVCGVEETKLRPFGRPIHGFGLRFVLPPLKKEQDEHNIRIESLLQDASKIFMENQSRFLTPISLQGDYLKVLKIELEKSYRYLKDNVSSFLEQYN